MGEEEDEEILYRPRPSANRAVNPPSPQAIDKFFSTTLNLPTTNHLGERRTCLTAVLEHPSSYSSDKTKQVDFQRREWLGDTILQFCVSQYLIETFPAEAENQLNKRRTAIVRESNLARWGRATGFAALLQVRGHVTDSIIADAVEALITTVFYEFDGMKSAAQVCRQIIEFESHQVTPITNAKSILQDWCVAALGQIPKFAFKTQDGPDHRPTFTVECTVIDPVLGTCWVVEGQGLTKQQAEEQACARLFSTEEVNPCALPTEPNLKGRLQERLGGAMVEYTLIKKLGPIHAPFHVQLRAKTYESIFAFGATKKEAESRAAWMMISKLDADTEEVADRFAASLSLSSSAPAAKAMDYDASPRHNVRLAANRGVDVDDTKSTMSNYSSISSSENTSLSPIAAFASNPKGRLQELLMRENTMLQPEYVFVNREGPDHAPLFTIHVVVGGEVWGKGKMRTKKRAEEMAAQDALERHGERFAHHLLGGNGGGAAAAAYSQLANPKGYLQEKVVKMFGAPPVYEESTLFTHIQQGQFEFQVRVNDVVRGSGVGTTKKEAQDNAARAAIQALGVQ